MKKLFITALVMLTMVTGSAFAGAKIKINDDAMIDLGYRVQTMGIFTQTDVPPTDGNYDFMSTWKTRRARFRLGGNIGEDFKFFMQTDHSGKDVVMIDAYIDYQLHPWVHAIMGRNMAPANRQNLTSSGALMAMDRPGLAYKSLTWGSRTLTAFSNNTFSQSVGSWTNAQGTKANILGSSVDAVRDQGLTFFGSGDVGENGHLKYYAGIYNGVQVGNSGDKDRMTVRVQYNLWDAEPGYYNSSTYLGKKKTLGVGVSYDMQKEVGFTGNHTGLADYAYMTVDGFLEYPMGDNGDALTAEVAWMNLDFDDHVDMMNAQGSGFYGQAGYFLAESGFQPWVEFEQWSSDHATDMGSFTTFRGGVTYYVEGQNANIKLGVEQFKSDTALTMDAMGNTIEDSILSVVLGMFVTY
jgi:hypothetical protein